MKPSVASLSDGSFVVTWESHNQDGSSNGIYGQRYDSSGAAAGDEFKINTYTTSSQEFSSVTSLGQGAFVVTWSSDGQDGSSNGIYGQRYDSSGAAAGNEFQVNSYTMQNQMDPAVAGLSDGSFVVTWESYNQDGSSNGIYGQRYDSSGAAAGVEEARLGYTTQGQGGPAVAGLSDGSFVVTWSSDGQDGSSNGIYGQRYDSSGAAAGDEFKINTYTTSSQEFSSVTSLGQGAFVVTWSSDGQDGSSKGIYGQRYDSSGAAAGDEFKINTYTTSSQEFSSVTSLGQGAFVVTWSSDGQDGSSKGIYGQRYDSSGASDDSFRPFH